jgi:regulator of protease activity HflC (stomatin/prohibitin superfamily)
MAPTGVKGRGEVPMDTALTALLVVLGVVAVVLLTYVVIRSFVFVVQQGTVLVVKRWGKHHAVYSSGPHFKLPFIDTKHRVFSSQRQSLPLELSGDSGGRLPVDMDVDLELRGVTDKDTVLRLAYEIENALQHLRTVAVAEVRQLLLPMSFEEILADANLAGRIVETLQSVAAECGYTIIGARITSIRPERSVQAAIIESERNAHVRTDQAAQSEHESLMRLTRARSAAEASAIEAGAERSRLAEQTEQVVDLLARMAGANITGDNATAILTALLHQQTVTTVGANANAQVILTPTGLKLPDDIAGITALQFTDTIAAVEK